jgi:anti-sigma B factor antagonist
MSASEWPPVPVVLHRGVSGSTVIVVLAGELDLASAAVLHRVLAGSPCPKAPNITVDLRRVRFMDCSSLHAFVAGFEESRRCGGCLRVVEPQRQPALLLRETRMTGLFCLHRTMQSATAPACPRHGRRAGA